MFDHRHYVPVLKAKAGELRALRELDSSVKARFTPLLEVPPVAWDHVNDQPSKTLDEHLRTVVESICTAWQGDAPAFLDFYDPGALTDASPVITVFDDLWNNGCPVIPVTAPDRPDAYHDAIKDVVRRAGRGVCLRVEPRDLESSAEDTIDLMLSLYNVEPDKCDFVLDFRDVSPGQGPTITWAARSILNEIPHLTEWRTLTLLASAFPENMSGIRANSIEAVERTEWLVWNSLVRSANGKRIPTFGDYGIQHPNLTEVDPRLIRMSANIRYTVAEAWLILKGRDVRVHRHEQFHELCRKLVARSEFCGATFSPGDEYIARCAEEAAGPGNATTWRQVGTSHHLTFVVNQIANLFAT